jgi:hypothetical protein
MLIEELDYIPCQAIRDIQNQIIYCSTMNSNLLSKKGDNKFEKTIINKSNGPQERHGVE